TRAQPMITTCTRAALHGESVSLASMPCAGYVRRGTVRPFVWRSLSTRTLCLCAESHHEAEAAGRASPVPVGRAAARAPAQAHLSARFRLGCAVVGRVRARR